MIVISLDISKSYVWIKFKPTIIADAQNLPFKSGGKAQYFKWLIKYFPITHEYVIKAKNVEKLSMADSKLVSIK